jgi:FlaA1/EpsC-like NDP-sugar epimerase
MTVRSRPSGTRGVTVPWTGTAPWLQDFIRVQILLRLQLHGWTFIRDAAVVSEAYTVAEFLRFDGFVPDGYSHSLVFALPITAAVYAVFSYLFGLHRRIWRYAALRDLRAMVDACFLSASLVGIVALAVGSERFFPLSVAVIGSVFAVGGLIVVRLWATLFPVHRGAKVTGDVVRVLIIGAGQAGNLVAADLFHHPHSLERPIAFLDDDSRKWKMRIHGLPVLGGVNLLPDIVRSHQIDTVALALPSATTRDLDRILALALTTDARIQLLPSQAEVLAGRSSSMNLRDIKLDTLLSRIPSSALLEGPTLQDTVTGQVVLVTGAAGSIGSELCRQLIALRPKCVLALDNNETGLFDLQRDVSMLPGGELLTPILTSVTAHPKLGLLFGQHRPDVVFHAAAYKHVPMLQSHVDEAVFVNVKGTASLCYWAAKYQCKRFVFVSTDKAVNPANALGFSKRIGELLMRAYDSTSDTVFCAVRFGNVIGSRGSALPEFVRQIDTGGPVTVTHPDVERYFMTIPEAVSLVIQAGAFAEGGELFMLDMGDPIKIGDLVNRLIRLRGLRVGKDIKVRYTGLRPGEKLTEDLVFTDEKTRPTEIPSVFAVEDSAWTDLAVLKQRIDYLVQQATSDDASAVVDSLARIARCEPVAPHFSLRPGEGEQLRIASSKRHRSAAVSAPAGLPR